MNFIRDVYYRSTAASPFFINAELTVPTCRYLSGMFACTYYSSTIVGGWSLPVLPPNILGCGLLLLQLVLLPSSCDRRRIKSRFTTMVDEWVRA